MWIVYNKQDSWECGWAVASEEEARRQCEEDENLTYIFAGILYKEV